MYLLAQAALTIYHRLNDLKNRKSIFFFTVLEAGNPKLRLEQDLVSEESSLFDLKWLCVQMAEREWNFSLPLINLQSSPLWTHFTLINILSPDVITWGLGLQYVNFREINKIHIANMNITYIYYTILNPNCLYENFITI